MMRYLISIVLTGAYFFSNAQESHRKEIEHVYEFVKRFENGFELYVNNCTDTIFNDVIVKTMTEKSDSLRKYIEDFDRNKINFTCVSLSDSNLPVKVYQVLGEEHLKNKICFVNCMLYHDQTPIYFLFVFTKSGLKQYKEKKVREQSYVEHPTGKVRVRHKVNFSTYALKYTLIKKGENWHLY